ncbi:MAG: hypothetical protein ACREX9_22535 [Gammaproteobacteria bacterium]
MSELHAGRESPRRIGFFLENRRAICEVSGPLNQAGLAALTFADHGLGAEEAERSFLLYRLGPALAEAQKARRGGVQAFPFFSDRYVYDGTWPPARKLDLAQLMREVGID